MKQVIKIFVYSFLVIAASMAQREGDVVLEGGVAHMSGNVLIWIEGKWWAVCDDGWSLHAAKVVCKILGYPLALGFTTRSYYGHTKHEIGLDNVQCHGVETSLLDCHHEPIGEHNCDSKEAAGVSCGPRHRRTTHHRNSNYTTTAATTAANRSHSATHGPKQNDQNVLELESVRNGSRDARAGEEEGLEAIYKEVVHLDRLAEQKELHMTARYEIRIVGGRTAKEGRVEILVGGVWGVICSDRWTLLEARVACRQAGLFLAKTALQANFFGGDDLVKLVSGMKCDGEEETLSECYHEHIGSHVVCPRADMVAGVVCSRELPDLEPNATLLMTSSYLHDQPLYYLQCAMEENCASPSAFKIKKNRYDWHVFKRRLLRFSCSIWNFGTADFRPHIRKEEWEWHLCHMHYHSMQIFAHYDILDGNGNRVAEGHKASFCLEDVRCKDNVTKKYACQGFGDQGISVGCADDYLHDIDCQWIDVTDVKPGNYTFKVHVNPEYRIGELNYNNNAALCNLFYSGYDVRVTNCTLGRG